MSYIQENNIEYETLSCSRPHCAIRCHNHDIKGTQTFAEFLNYLPHFWTISRRYNLDDKNLIKTYKYFSSNKASKGEIITFIKDILSKINNETKDIELKKIQVLYLYSMLYTPDLNKFIKQSEKLFLAVKDAFSRAIIDVKDELFSEQMAKITL